MSQEVLYRRWRPQTFADICGQDPVTTTLRNAVAAGAPAHAYLLTGPRGTGKTTTGRILAKAVNCDSTEGGEPCDRCDSCQAFASGRALDLIELDAASNRGIDEVRALRESVGYSPNSARYKVYLIDEVHMLTDAAFNALLKTLEEPPPHVIFVLATTEPHRIPATVSSRCQRFDLRRIPLADTVARLQHVASGEGISVAAGGLELIAREATGSLRDALNLLDQLRAYHGSDLTLETVRSGLGLVVDDRTVRLARASIDRDLNAGLGLLASARDDGLEMRAFLRAVVESLRTILLLKAGAEAQLELSDTEVAELRPVAEGAHAADIVAALSALGSVDFQGDAYDSLPAEIAFASLAITEPQAQQPAPAQAAPAHAAPAHAAPAQPAPAQAAPAQAAPAQAAAAQVAPAQVAAEGATASPPRTERRAPPPQRADPPREAARAPRPPEPRRERAPAAPTMAPTAAAGAPPAAAQPPATRRANRGPSSLVPPDEGDVPEELLALRERWGEIRDAARTRHFRAGALLNTPCLIKSFEGDTVEIGFRFPKHVELVLTFEDGQVLQILRDVLSEVVGRPVTVVPVLWEALQGSAVSTPRTANAADAPADAPADAGGHMIEEARKLGAVSVEDQRA